MKHGMKITCMEIIEIILMLGKHTMVATMKEDTPKVAFKDHSKPKVEEKGRLITNPMRCFKCNGVGHTAINCPAKRTLVFGEDLNGWIEKSDDDCQERNEANGMVTYMEKALKDKLEEFEDKTKTSKSFPICSISKDHSREQFEEFLFLYSINPRSSSLCSWGFEVLVSSRCLSFWPSNSSNLSFKSFSM
ncbi:hypothetical protein M9H77_17594 [Catharanthus roseus]|uniref:Uncharacterized protein n=1 Tax=Catharanthus roseus TaxID=4058 RepID=A0ACC0B510_CATRO|nr:hypothetical protein M9H77_17594 [Catharanthus roseus]